MSDPRACYATRDEIADPGAHAPRLDDLPGSLRGLHAQDEGGGAATFNLPCGEWVRRFRAHGLAVGALVEPRPPGGTSTFWGKGTDWTRRWPAELVWKVRRE